MAKFVALDGYKDDQAGLPEIHAEGCGDITKKVVGPYGPFAREILGTGSSLEEIAEKWFAASIDFAEQQGETKEDVMPGLVGSMWLMNCAKKALKASK